MSTLLIFSGAGLMVFALIIENFSLLLVSFAISLPAIFSNAIGNIRSRSQSTRFQEDFEGRRREARLQVEKRTNELQMEVPTFSAVDRCQYVLKGLRGDVACFPNPYLRSELANEIEKIELRAHDLNIRVEKRQQRLLDLRRQRQVLDEGAEDLSYWVRFIKEVTPNISAELATKTTTTGVLGRDFLSLARSVGIATGYWKSTSNIWGEIRGGTVCDIDGLDAEFEDAAVIDMYRKIEKLKSTGCRVPLTAD